MSFISQFQKAFPDFTIVTFVRDVESNLKDCQSILDVGCGENSPLRLFDNKYATVGVDGYKPAIAKSKKNNIHDKYIQLDIRKLSKEFKKNSYDAVIALDVIEHLPKEEGYKLLLDMERIARKKVIVSTPNGFVEQVNKYNKLQAHLSGWTVEDFKKLKYQVQGIYGLKFFKILRNKEAEIRFKPKMLWSLVWGVSSEITHHLFTKDSPKHAISLLAVKTIK